MFYTANFPDSEKSSSDPKLLNLEHHENNNVAQMDFSSPPNRNRINLSRNSQYMRMNQIVNAPKRSPIIRKSPNKIRSRRRLFPDPQPVVSH